MARLARAASDEAGQARASLGKLGQPQASSGSLRQARAASGKLGQAQASSGKPRPARAPPSTRGEDAVNVKPTVGWLPRLRGCRGAGLFQGFNPSFLQAGYSQNFCRV
ncbi:putative Epstein Barr nuclear antigen -3B [Equid gammaherpesvirus 5]|nr:putative Epstein Barr nuclear antigen -3B [Equid gammaherpesvirus 5]